MEEDDDEVSDSLEGSWFEPRGMLSRKSIEATKRLSWRKE